MTDFHSIPVIDVARELLGPIDPARSSRVEKHFNGHAGLFVNATKNKWYSHGNGAGGDALDLVLFAEGCDYAAGISWLRSHGFMSERRVSLSNVVAHDDLDDDATCRVEYALSLWAKSIPLPSTRGWRYFVEHRGLDIARLDRLDHALRWNRSLGAVVALMTDAGTNKPTGIHRTFLNPDGTKRERKMLGRTGVVRLSRDEDVLEGLGITEGIEDGLAVLLSGWAPVWAATSAGAIERFPMLSGIESLTIFADNDEAGIAAASTCAERWLTAGREARIFFAKDGKP